jgi:PAS domain S-box-containing protein
MTFVFQQRDFLSFVPLFSFILCSVESVVLNMEEKKERRWLSFLAFFSIQALSLGWRLISAAASAGGGSAFVAPALQALSFSSLLAFATPGNATARRKWIMVAASLFLVAVCIAAGALQGPGISSLLALLLLVIPGVFFAIRFVLRDPAVRDPGRPWLVAFAASLAAFAVARVATSLSTTLLDGWGVDGFLLGLNLVSLALAATLSLHQWRSFERENHRFGRRLTRVAIYGSFVSLPIILVAGGFLTDMLGGRAEADLRSEYESSTEITRTAIESRIAEIDRDTDLLATSPLTRRLVARRDRASLDELVGRLDQYAAALDMDCWVVDRGGAVIASSRAAPIGSEGDFRSATWFTDAMAGSHGRQFTVDPESRARRYYSSAPLWDPVEGITGVVVAAHSVEPLMPAVAAEEVSFLVDQAGFVLFSSEQPLLFHLLWPSGGKVSGVVPASQARALVESNPVLNAKPLMGDHVRWQGREFMVTRSFLSVPGWSVVQFGSLHEFRQYRLAGILGTLVVVLVVAAFSAAGQLSLLGEARVERAAALYRVLIEGAPDWVSIVAAGGRFLFTNTGGRQGLGIPAADGRDGGDGRVEAVIGAENISALAGQVEVALRGNVVSVETALPAADGEVKVWRLTLVPLREDERTDRVILIGNDVSEARRAQAQLVRVERLAALGTLATGIAHHFNNINMVALGYLELATRETAPGELLRGYLENIEVALRRSVDITARLLPLGAPGRAELSPVSLGECVQDVVHAMEAEARAEQTGLHLSLGETPPVAVNREQLEFVVRELIGNARHAVLGREGARVLVETGTRGEEAYLRVQDNGVGIAPDRLSSLFTPFFSGKGEHAPPDSSQARVRGVGLSLSVAHAIVASWAGRIDAESGEGTGSTFTVWLPRAPGR